MKNLIIIGSDVYAHRVIKCIEALIKSGEEISIKGILDNNEEKNDVKGYKILDKIDNANLYNDEDTSFIIAIKNNKTRQEIADKFQEFDYYTVIHPKTHIGENVYIGKGSIIMDEVIIKDNTKIGNHVIINHGCIIDEEVIVEDYVNLLQSSSLGKQVKVDSLTSIGRDVLVIPKIYIGKKSIVKNASIVIEDVGDNCLMEGTTAKIIKKL